MTQSQTTQKQKPDLVNHPPHYTSHPSKVEAITICEHLNFCLGNVFKYVFRSGLKHNSVEDLRKAAWYAERAKKVPLTGYSPPGHVIDALDKIVLYEPLLEKRIFFSLIKGSFYQYHKVVNEISEQVALLVVLAEEEK